MLSNEEYIASLKGLCSIESVAGADCSDAAPYGAGSAKALDYVLNLCESFGFRTVNRYHKIGWAEIGEGEEMVGILAHLDVVPAGKGWNYEPYSVTEVGDRLYGRGVTDDKGPAMACIYAMKDLMDSGVKLQRRVRIIFGQSEENGEWTDMQYYVAHEELPTFGFTPDADFPAIYGEKRLLCFRLTMPLDKSGLVHAEAGDASNVVPNACTIAYNLNGEEKTLATKGVSSHASTPQDGKNAILDAVKQLASVEGLNSPLVNFIHEQIGECTNGSQIGCGLEDDKSGELTMNVGTLRTKGDVIEMQIDVREPVTFPDSAVIDPVTAAAEKYGFKVEVTENTPPVFMDKNGPVITKLLEVYRAETGDMSEPTVIGGGTYARAMDHIVAFGPMLPGRELTEHQANEYILREDLLMIRRVYANAIRALAE